jgi:hypothetical protein
MDAPACEFGQSSTNTHRFERFAMTTTATFSLSTGRIVLFGDPAADAHRRVGVGDALVRDAADAEAGAELDTALISGGIGRDGLTITASSGRVRVLHGFIDQPRYQRGRRRRNG